jgi:hypothetical protein
MTYNSWIEFTMIRNLLASVIILAASTSAFSASIIKELEVPGADRSGIVGSALSACADEDCTAGVIADALAAKMDVASVMTIAIAANKAANLPASDAIQKVAAVAIAAKVVSVAEVMAAAVSSGAANSIDAPAAITTVSKAAIAANISVDDIMTAAVSTVGISQSDAVQGITQAAVDSKISISTVVQAAKNAKIDPTIIVDAANKTSAPKADIQTAASSAEIDPTIVADSIAAAVIAAAIAEPTAAGNITNNKPVVVKVDVKIEATVTPDNISAN